MMTDPIADFLTRVRNANMAKHDTVKVPSSKLKQAIAEILKREGFIKDFDLKKDNKQGMLRIFMRYGPDSTKVISGMQRISKPGLRVYAQKDELPKVLGGLGIAVISTSKGVLTDKEARQAGVGGEVLCYIW